jgi:hypothetical protein
MSEMEEPKVTTNLYSERKKTFKVSSKKECNVKLSAWLEDG